MERLIILIMIPFLLGTASLPVKASGDLTLYRWNPGYRAETDASFSAKLTEQEYRQFRSTQALPEGSASKEKLYSGCYLAKFERSSEGRKLAEATPERELQKVCFSREQF